MEQEPLSILDGMVVDACSDIIIIFGNNPWISPTIDNNDIDKRRKVATDWKNRRCHDIKGADNIGCQHCY